MICIGTFDILEDTETFVDGNNDDNWALGEFFIYFLRVFFLIFNDLHRYYGYSKGSVWFNAGNNHDNRPKRRETRRLGPR